MSHPSPLWLIFTDVHDSMTIIFKVQNTYVLRCYSPNGDIYTRLHTRVQVCFVHTYACTVHTYL
jgi:hypothetical protein